MRACACVGGEDAEKRRRDGSATKLSSVRLRYQLEDDGVLELGDPKATVRLWEVSRGGRKRETRSSISQRSPTQRSWRDLCGIGDRIGEAAVKE